MTPEQVRNTLCPYLGKSEMCSRVWGEALTAIADAMDREAAEQAVAVDEEWLRSVGFMEGWKELYLFYEGTRLEYRNSEVHRAWVLNNQAYPLDKWRTRGDVLRLLAALGINAERGGE